MSARSSSPDASRSSIWSATPSRSRSTTSGYCAWKRASEAGRTYALIVGWLPTATVPRGAPDSSSIAERPASTEASARSACDRNRSPALVSTTPAGVRTTSFAPTDFSSCWTRRDRLGCVVPRLRAALVKRPVRATATKARS